MADAPSLRNLADRLTVETKALADLKIEKAAVLGERRPLEADLRPGSSAPTTRRS
jgi:hypothetical protein